MLIEPIKTWQNKDLMELAGIVLAEHDAVPYSMRPQAIYIDAIGLGADWLTVCESWTCRRSLCRFPRRPA